VWWLREGSVVWHLAGCAVAVTVIIGVTETPPAAPCPSVMEFEATSPLKSKVSPVELRGRKPSTFFLLSSAEPCTRLFLIGNNSAVIKDFHSFFS
jgi:hypothetical protein